MIPSGEKGGRGPSGNCWSSVILLQSSSSPDATQRLWRGHGDRPGALDLSEVGEGPSGGFLSFSGSWMCICHVLLKALATREGEGRRKMIPEEKKKMKSHCNELFLYF